MPVIRRLRRVVEHGVTCRLISAVLHGTQPLTGWIDAIENYCATEIIEQQSQPCLLCREVAMLVRVYCPG